MRDCWLVGGDRRAFHWGAKRLQERERGSGAQPRTAGWCSRLRGLQASGRAGPLGITPPATRCPSPSAGSATAVSHASDPGKAQRAASSTPIRPPTHTQGASAPPDHGGGSYTSSTGPYTSWKRTQVKRSTARPTAPRPAQATDFQSQKGSPVGTREASRHSTSGALAGPKGSTSKEGLSLASWPQAKHVPSPAPIQHRGRSRRSDREVHQEMPGSAFIETRAGKHAVGAQRNHSFSRGGGKTLQMRNTC